MSLPRKVPTPTPPAKGSFPLDHEGHCRYEMLKYMLCLNEHEVGDGYYFLIFLISHFLILGNQENFQPLLHHFFFQQRIGECRDFAKVYLQCRMDNGLMQQEEWKYLGFSDQNET
uniref:COX assembly mitochondrial protein n=1 Tax=Brugia timori TaxID=42155 RepID=A0A0R3QLE5_9BILA